MHKSFGNVRDLDEKILRTSETLVSEVYVGCLCILCIYIKGKRGFTIYRKHIVDKIMDICV
jgi:hypothetical protein